jgi:hypothetical protein
MVINVFIGSIEFFNTRALLFPFMRFSEQLRDSGIQVNVIDRASGDTADCDLLILDSKVFRAEWQVRASQALEKIDKLTEGQHKTLWFNTGDSSGGIQHQVIDLVDRYYKGQLLRDRSLYRKRYYGGRIYTDYYSQKDLVNDSSEIYSPVLTTEQIAKLRVSWNLGMNPCMDYWTGLLGHFVIHPRLLGLLKHRLSNDPTTHHGSKRADPIVNSRMSVNYSRETISHQRQVIFGLLAKRGLHGSKVTRQKYFAQLGNSNFAVSPFGWGEVCIRDFEAILCGAILIKPDMDHLETWPNIYSNGETYLPFSWDLDLFDDWFEDVILGGRDNRSVAEAAFNRYRGYVGPTGAEKFIQKINMIADDLGIRGC